VGLHRALYIDTSALIKLAVPEPESEAMVELVTGTEFQLVSSEIAEVEAVRTFVKRAPDRLDDCHRILASMIILPLSPSIRLRAEYVKPTHLRSLDAIHLATALEIEPELGAFVSYDNRLLEAARTVGLTALSPGV
jgi:predicted nucleic acid-binding protein